MKEGKCLICEGTIFRKTSGRRRAKVTRGKNGITCSTRCSRAYQRIYRHLNIRIKRNLEKKYGQGKNKKISK